MSGAAAWEASITLPGENSRREEDRQGPSAREDEVRDSRDHEAPEKYGTAPDPIDRRFTISQAVPGIRNP